MFQVKGLISMSYDFVFSTKILKVLLMQSSAFVAKSSLD
jgi:hypothetical protein